MGGTSTKQLTPLSQAMPTLYGIISAILEGDCDQDIPALGNEFVGTLQQDPHQETRNQLRTFLQSLINSLYEQKDKENIHYPQILTRDPKNGKAYFNRCLQELRAHKNNNAAQEAILLKIVFLFLANSYQQNQAIYSKENTSVAGKGKQKELDDDRDEDIGENFGNTHKKYLMHVKKVVREKALANGGDYWDAYQAIKAASEKNEWQWQQIIAPLKQQLWDYIYKFTNDYALDPNNSSVAILRGKPSGEVLEKDTERQTKTSKIPRTQLIKSQQSIFSEMQSHQWEVHWQLIEAKIAKKREALERELSKDGQAQFYAELVAFQQAKKALNDIRTLEINQSRHVNKVKELEKIAERLEEQFYLYEAIDKLNAPAQPEFSTSLGSSRSDSDVSSSPTSSDNVTSDAHPEKDARFAALVRNIEVKLWDLRQRDSLTPTEDNAETKQEKMQHLIQAKMAQYLTKNSLFKSSQERLAEAENIKANAKVKANNIVELTEYINEEIDKLEQVESRFFAIRWLRQKLHLEMRLLATVRKVRDELAVLASPTIPDTAEESEEEKKSSDHERSTVNV